jgi:hypothetical protein
MFKPILLIVTLAGVMLASPSFGHAKLVNSSPASGAGGHEVLLGSLILILTAILTTLMGPRA